MLLMRLENGESLAPTNGGHLQHMRVAAGSAIDQTGSDTEPVEMACK